MRVSGDEELPSRDGPPNLPLLQIPFPSRTNPIKAHNISFIKYKYTLAVNFHSWKELIKAPVRWRIIMSALQDIGGFKSNQSWLMDISPPPSSCLQMLCLFLNPFKFSLDLKGPHMVRDSGWRYCQSRIQPFWDLGKSRREISFLVGLVLDWGRR